MSTDNKPTVQQAAKQGNPQAIALLLNRQLQPKGIMAKVSAKDSCLQIMLEAANVPNQKGLVAAIQKWIDGLGIDSIQRVQIYAKQTGEEIPSWNDSFEVIRHLEELKIDSSVLSPISSPTVATEKPKSDLNIEEIDTQKLHPALVKLAKNGYYEAISALIENKLQNSDLQFRIFKLYLLNGQLNFELRSEKLIEQESVLPDIRELLTDLDSDLIEKVNISCIQELRGKSDNYLWRQSFNLDLLDKVNKPDLNTSEISKELIQQQKTDYLEIYNAHVKSYILRYENLSSDEKSGLREWITEICESIIKEYAFSAVSYTVVASAYFQLGYFEQSIDSCNKALVLDPLFIKAREIRLQNLEEVIKSLIDDTGGVHLLNTGGVHFLNIDEKAKSTLSKFQKHDISYDFVLIISISKNNEDIMNYYLCRGFYFYLLNAYNDAIKDFSFFIKYDTSMRFDLNIRSQVFRKYSFNTLIMITLMRAKCFYCLQEYENCIEDCNRITTEELVNSTKEYIKSAFNFRSQSKKALGDKTGATSDLGLAKEIEINIKAKALVEKRKNFSYGFIGLVVACSLYGLLLFSGSSRYSKEGEIVCKSGNPLLDASCKANRGR